MTRVRREHEEIDLFWADIVALQFDRFAQCRFQLSLNHIEKSFVGQRLAPELDDELIIHQSIVSPTLSALAEKPRATPRSAQPVTCDASDRRSAQATPSDVTAQVQERSM